ncbi:hypothetical protein G9A89_016862 [Geosiphon pyriformis]|nr:hypothetical protein G9A89_016862 [Geosiphon pyriformis]
MQNVSVNFGSSVKIKLTSPIAKDIKNRFAVLESSLTSLVEQISYIVIGLGLSETTSGKTAAFLDLFSNPDMVKFENMLNSLSILVFSLSACFDGLVLTGSMYPQSSSQ